MKKIRIPIKISRASLLAMAASVTFVSVTFWKIGQIVVDKFILNIGGTVVVNPPPIGTTSPDEAPKTAAIPAKQETASPEIITDSKPYDDSILQNGIPNVGFLADKYSTSLRTFTLDYPGAVEIVFRPSGRDTASYRLTVRDTFGTVLTQKNIYDEVLSSNTGNLYLRAGTYRAEVARLYSWSGKPYTLTINISHAANAEEEPNDTLSTANVIRPNEDIRASTGTRSDVDYFTFTLDKTTSIRPYLEFAPVKNYSLKLYELRIENINGTYSKDFTFRGDAKISKAIKPFTLKPGTYIISLSRVEDKKIELGLHEYTLRVLTR